MMARAYAQAADAADAAHDVPFWMEPEAWLTVAFLIFVGLLARPVWKRATAALDGRAAEIALELEEARKLREEAQAALASYQRKQRGATKEAAEILAQAEEDAKRFTREAEARLGETLKRHETLAEEKIAQAQARAVADLRAEAVEIALAATRKLLEERLDPAKAEALVDDAIKDLPQKLQ